MRRTWKQLAENERKKPLNTTALYIVNEGEMHMSRSVGNEELQEPLLGQDSAVCSQQLLVWDWGKTRASNYPVSLGKKLSEFKLCFAVSSPCHRKKIVEFNRCLIPKLSYSVILFLQVQALSLKYSYCYQHLWYAWEENTMYLRKDLILSLW